MLNAAESNREDGWPGASTGNRHACRFHAATPGEASTKRRFLFLDAKSFWTDCGTGFCLRNRFAAIRPQNGRFVDTPAAISPLLFSTPVDTLTKVLSHTNTNPAVVRAMGLRYNDSRVAHLGSSNGDFMNTHAERAFADRDDFSTFLVHLTRHDLEDDDGGDTAENNFRNMLAAKTINALRAHCLYNDQLRRLDKQQQRAFRVTCYTEAPLDQLDQFVRFNDRRAHNFQPYGFVFHKDCMLRKGAEKATYLNGYAGTTHRRTAYDEVFKIAVRNGFTGKVWRQLPFVNVMHDGYDFAWEREWRIAGDLKFKLSDLVCVILPEGKHADLRTKLDKQGVAVVSPGWPYGRVVHELSRQKRKARQHAKERRASRTGD